MTRTNKLDSILNGLLFLEKKRLAHEPIPKKTTIEFMCDSLKLDCEPWEMSSLKDELKSDNYIVEHDEELFITDEGRKFITRYKGYAHQLHQLKTDDEIRKQTLDKFKYDKYSFWLSILALVIAGLSLILSYIKQ